MIITYFKESQEMEFDIEFNEMDFVIQVESNECLYNDIFSIVDLKKQNNFFDDMEIIKEMMLKCFNKEDKCSLIIKQEKSLLMVFSINIGLKKNLEMVLELLPIRKDISNSTEIISLKRKVKMLESCISPRFLFHDKYLYPLNLNYDDIICFSPVLGNTIKLSFSYSINNSSSLYDIFSTSVQSYCHSGVNKERIYINDIYGNQKSSFYNNSSFVKVLNISVTKTTDFLTEELKRSASKKFAFYDIMMPDNLSKYLSKDITTLYFINVNVSGGFNSYLKKLLDQFLLLSSITICQGITPIDSINCLKETTRTLNIRLCGKKPYVHEHGTFPTNIKITEQFSA